MAKAKGARSAARTGGSAKSNKKLEALRRAQKIDEILLMGNVQSQAGSDSAAEERPAGESHIVDLLESRKISAGRNVFARPASARKKAPSKARRPAAKKSRPRPKPKKGKGAKRKR